MDGPLCVAKHVTSYAFTNKCIEVGLLAQRHWAYYENYSWTAFSRRNLQARLSGTVQFNIWRNKHNGMLEIFFHDFAWWICRLIHGNVYIVLEEHVMVGW